jgi:hypothetical protein
VLCSGNQHCMCLHHSCRDVRMVYIDKLLFHSIGCISYASARWKCCCFLLN